MFYPDQQARDASSLNGLFLYEKHLFKRETRRFSGDLRFINNDLSWSDPRGARAERLAFFEEGDANGLGRGRSADEPGQQNNGEHVRQCLDGLHGHLANNGQYNALQAYSHGI